MAKITFLLNGNRVTEKQDKNYSIFFRCRDSSTNIGVMQAINPLIYKTSPKLWDTNRMRIKLPRRKAFSKYISENMIEAQRKREELNEILIQEVNLKLDEIELHFTKYFMDAYKARRIITNKDIKEEFSYFMTGKSQNRVDMHEFINKYIEASKKTLADGTIRSYKTSQKKLKEFHKEEYPINFETITKKFAQDFKDWLFEDDKHPNYVGKIFKHLRMFINEARNDNYTNIDISSNKAFFVKSIDTIKIYLTDAELTTIKKLKLKGQMELSRDLFLIGANTGMRISDFNNLNEAVIEKKDNVFLLKYVAQKTKKNSVAPVNELVYELYHKYKGNPPKIANKTINENLKVIAQMANLNDEVQIKIAEKGIEKTEKVIKHTLVSSHTARRSFATNQYLKGTDPHLIMAATGHTTLAMLFNYIKVTNDEKVIKMMQNSNTIKDAN